MFSHNKIGMVGKYVELHDSYISVNEALKHGGIATRSAVDIHWINIFLLRQNINNGIFCFRIYFCGICAIKVNNEYRADLAKGGMIFAGTSPDNHIVEMVELPNHPWYVAALLPKPPGTSIPFISPRISSRLTSSPSRVSESIQ